MARIKRFQDFSLNEDFSLQGLLSSVLPALGGGFMKQVKQKIAANILEALGIDEGSELSVLVQEFVDSIPVSDIPGIATGENINAKYFAPKFAQFLQEYVQRRGLDNIAAKFGINPNGWIYGTLRETLQTQLGKEKLTNFFLSAFGESPHIGHSALSSLSGEEKQKFSDALNKRISQGYQMGNTTAAKPAEDKKDGGTPGFFSSHLKGAQEAQS
jgi:hypothetical protein